MKTKSKSKNKSKNKSKSKSKNKSKNKNNQSNKKRKSKKNKKYKSKLMQLQNIKQKINIFLSIITHHHIHHISTTISLVQGHKIPCRNMLKMSWLMGMNGLTSHNIIISVNNLVWALRSIRGGLFVRFALVQPLIFLELLKLGVVKLRFDYFSLLFLLLLLVFI